MHVILYTTSWCGHCVRLKRAMDLDGISYEEVDVDEDHSHDARIIAASGGYRTVPTVEIEGRLLVNPTVAELKGAVSET